MSIELLGKHLNLFLRNLSLKAIAIKHSKNVESMRVGKLTGSLQNNKVILLSPKRPKGVTLNTSSIGKNGFHNDSELILIQLEIPTLAFMKS